MWKVDIYLDTDRKIQKKTERKCAYVLETICAGATRTAEGFSEFSGTYHSANLQNLTSALSRITKTSEICVHTEDSYVAAHICRLPEMEADEWKDSKGNPIGNADLWINIWNLVKKHHLKITAKTEKHSYSRWMQEEFGKRGCERTMGTRMEPAVKTGPTNNGMSGYHY